MMLTFGSLCDGFFKENFEYTFLAVAYLGFHKGGIDFLWTLMFTQRMGKTMFSYFFPMVKTYFFGQTGSWLIGTSPKYSTGFWTVC